MTFKVTIGDSGVMDVSAPDFATAERFVREQAKGEAFSISSLAGVYYGQSFTIEPSAVVMAELQRQIDAGELCSYCCFRAPMVGLDLCRKCITY